MSTAVAIFGWVFVALACAAAGLIGWSLVKDTPDDALGALFGGGWCAIAALVVGLVWVILLCISHA